MAQTYTDRPTLAAWNALESSIVCGTYTGDGERTRTISLGFTPRAVLVMARSGETATLSGSTWTQSGGLALPNVPVECIYSPTFSALKIVDGGFEVYKIDVFAGAGVDYLHTNLSDAVYVYLALR